ncbi:hypothetical protein GQX74_003111 [Glossina fuscipes]|nr:hypothetical protein GQX74_003111 [Glossina fuscipes]
MLKVNDCERFSILKCRLLHPLLREIYGSRYVSRTKRNRKSGILEELTKPLRAMDDKSVDKLKKLFPDNLRISPGKQKEVITGYAMIIQVVRNYQANPSNPYYTWYHLLFYYALILSSTPTLITINTCKARPLHIKFKHRCHKTADCIKILKLALKTTELPQL